MIKLRRTLCLNLLFLYSFLFLLSYSASASGTEQMLCLDRADYEKLDNYLNKALEMGTLLTQDLAQHKAKYKDLETALQIAKQESENLLTQLQLLSEEMEKQRQYSNNLESQVEQSKAACMELTNLSEQALTLLDQPSEGVKLPSFSTGTVLLIAGGAVAIGAIVLLLLL